MLWSEAITELGSKIDALNRELEKQYRHKGGTVKPLVNRICDVLEAIEMFAERDEITALVNAEMDARRMRGRQI